MLYQLSYASTLKPSKNSRTWVRIASAVGARWGPPLWIILTAFPPRHCPWYQCRLPPVKRGATGFRCTTHLPLTVGAPPELHLLYNVTMDDPSMPRANSVMPRNRAQVALATTIALVAVSLLAYFVWLRPSIPGRSALLALMPEDARAVLFMDLADLRKEPFFADLLAWAPKPDADLEYRQFIRDTGFDYEKDLDRVAVAFEQEGAQRIFFAVGDGHFDTKKIKAYAAKNGMLQNSGSTQIFSLPIAGSSVRLSFTYLGKGRLAFTNNNDFGPWLNGAKAVTDAEWRERFARVAGSPVFAVIRGEDLKDAFGSGAASQDLARRATGGISSPQLSSLFAQLP